MKLDRHHQLPVIGESDLAVVPASSESGDVEVSLSELEEVIAAEV
ncbi:MAG: hypothetical protein WA919_25200 [Coleofasciculaceae cyanobacterium]